MKPISHTQAARALKLNYGNIRKTAKQLGCSRVTLYRRVSKDYLRHALVNKIAKYEGVIRSLRLQIKQLGK